MATGSGTSGHTSDGWMPRAQIGWIDRQWIDGTLGPTRIDPYFAWAEATDFKYLHPNVRPVWFPLILKVSGNPHAHARSAAQFAEHIASLRHGRERFWIEIPSVYRHPPAGLEAATYFTAIVKAQFFEALTQEQWLRDAIEAFELCLPVVSDNDFETKPAELPHIANAPGVVVGIVDDGLAYVHERFRDTSHSRIDYFWNQDEIGGSSVKPPYGSVPLALGYGWELVNESKAELDALIKAATHPPNMLVDDDEAYRLSGVTERGVPANRSVRRRAGHGTHVMDVACGMSVGDTDAAHGVIAVQLPSRTTRDTSGSTLGKQALDAVRYILARAHALAASRGTPAWPVVVNLSYGTIAGPHDGTGLLEGALDEMIELRTSPMEVVLPAGNNQLSRCHAHFGLAAADTRTLQWRVLPDDATPSFMEIWLPRDGGGAPPGVEIQVAMPSGDTSPWVKSGTVVTWQRAGKNVLCLIAYFAKVAQSDRSMILIGIAPTVTQLPSWDVAPSGRWTVAIRNVGARIDVDAWIQRDDTPFGYPVRGRQSRFDDAGYQYRDMITDRLVETDGAASTVTYVRRAGTLNAIATGYNTVVGAFRRSDWSAASYSSSGPIAPPPAGSPRTRNGPDALAVSEDSPAQYGILAAGTRSGSVCAMDGSSVAAPQMTRWIAKQMATGATKPIWKAVDAMAAAEEANPPPVGTLPGQKPPLPVEREGYGRVAFPPIVHAKNAARRNTPR